MQEKEGKNNKEPETDDQKLEREYECVLKVQVGFSAVSVVGGLIGIVDAAMDVRVHGFQAAFSGRGITVGIAALAVGSIGTYFTSVQKERKNNEMHRRCVQNIFRELQAVNEEIQAVNEEIQAVNDKLGVDRIDGFNAPANMPGQIVKSIRLPKVITKAFKELSHMFDATVTYFVMKSYEGVERRVARGVAGKIFLDLWASQLNTLVQSALELYDWKRFEQSESKKTAKQQ